jgi:hypothetical protein
MKYYIIVPILAVFILAGCAKDNSIMGPQSITKQTQYEWVKLTNSSYLSVENTFSASESIDGSEGGIINLTQVYKGDGNWSKVIAKLTIPKGAFSGTQVISFTVNTENASIELYPNTTNFDLDLSLDLTFTGVNISGYDDSDLFFSYLDGNTIVPAKHTFVKVDKGLGLLKVLGAQINHFSRYGWSTIDGSPL